MQSALLGVEWRDKCGQAIGALGDFLPLGRILNLDGHLKSRARGYTMEKTENSQPTFPDIKRVPRASHSGPDPIAVCRRIEQRSSRQLAQLFSIKSATLTEA